jgi:putative nucleotidyltransferase with HDIG domain
VVGQDNKSGFGRIYLAAVPVVGLAILGLAVTEVAANPPSTSWLALTCLTALTGAYTLRIPGLVVRLSVSEPIVFLATLLYGPSAGTITAAVDALVMTSRLDRKVRTPHRIVFNVGALAIAVFPSALLYFQLAGLDARAPAYGALETFVGPLYLFAVSVFFLNSWLIAIALSVEKAVSPVAIWLNRFLWLAANYLASASIAAILVVFTQALDLALVALLLPLVVVSFLAFRTTLGRLDDANRHLSEVNRLHHSTIETLAMAIDAKDQVTHGHIRRVQRYAVGLARALGIKDDRQLRAVEAAALLHDMGKLAIPEFILKKPGKLTVSELAIMKTHAAIGADILTSIEFPYPVVPIVRHHHENWDGSGYPQGFRGADIPIGARILSVVDCYDALTSDRPYRPAMTAAQAIGVLSQRRGTMYDPLVVDAFINAHGQLRTEAEEGPIYGMRLPSQGSAVVHDDSPTETLTALAAPIESLRLLASLSPYPAAPSLESICLRLFSSLRAIATFDTVALFVVDEASAHVQALFVEGSGESALARAKIPLGEQLTGWVAAHRTAVFNSDGSLDLASTTSVSKFAIGSSMPLVVGNSLVGVLTLYGESGQAISVEQRCALEVLLPSVSTSLADSLQRPCIAIDCRRAHVCDAAVAAVDSLLSHSRSQPVPRASSILGVEMEVVSTDTQVVKLSLESATRNFATLLAPASANNRCVLVLGPGQFLVCALDDAPAESMVAEAVAASQSRASLDFVFTVSSVSTPLDLRARVLRARGTAATSLSAVRAGA